MKRLYIAFIVSLLISCGAIEPQDLHKPRVVSAKLSAQVKRVEPLLAWTCSGRVPARAHNFACVKEGDGVSMLGRWILDTGDVAKMSAILESIGPDGRPWRNPERVNNDDADSSSRDQMLGLLEATIASGDKSGLQSVMRYVSKKGNLCPGDDRCRITPSVRTAVKDVLGEKVGAAERALDAETLYMEAELAPANYRAYLVARKLMIHIRTHTMNKAYEMAAKRLDERFPENLFIAVVNNLANDEDHKHVVQALTDCLREWKGPGPDWWGSAMKRHCTDKMQGHEMVALAKFLIH
jgi:hypothetical protein